MGVRFLTEDDRANPDQFWNKNDRDLVYTGLNIKFVKAFLAQSKMKVNGKMCSNSNIRKYKDTILWGSGQAKSPLPSTFYNEINWLLKLFKKEMKKDAKGGMLDEKEVDPIS